ncbi:MAG: histidine--tRNA ligase [Christensenellaceae bacterium]
MKKTPPKGMRDYLPEEMALRRYVENTIRKVYQQFGFVEIGTSALESIENLTSSEGGENLALIFEVLKRGVKREAALKNNAALSDLGLRYDLTVPLARYYVQNKAKLPYPFKCIQIGSVYRAERPQRGRFREFMQCDIDILGDASLAAEKELIMVTATALEALGFSGFTIQINHREILRALLRYFGFSETVFPRLLTLLDKFEKMSFSDFAATLLAATEYPPTSVKEFLAFLEAGDFSLLTIKRLLGDIAAIAEVEEILKSLTPLSSSDWQLAFSLTLIRGQGYYTGCVFEAILPSYTSSIAGGGRYDNMIEKFVGSATPAVGFSIGFERVLEILKAQKFIIPMAKPKLAVLYDTTAPFSSVWQETISLRAQYDVTILPLQKKLGRQLKNLATAGFAYSKIIGEREIKCLEA